MIKVDFTIPFFKNKFSISQATIIATGSPHLSIVVGTSNLAVKCCSPKGNLFIKLLLNYCIDAQVFFNFKQVDE